MPLKKGYSRKRRMTPLDAFVQQYMGIPLVEDERVPDGRVRIVNQVHDSVVVEFDVDKKPIAEQAAPKGKGPKPPKKRGY